MADDAGVKSSYIATTFYYCNRLWTDCQVIRDVLQQAMHIHHCGMVPILCLPVPAKPVFYQNGRKTAKRGCIFLWDVVELALISKSCDWAALHWFATSERAGWWDPLACNAGLSPRSCRLNFSRVGRVTPLCVNGVNAPESAP